jgi:predicted amidohydrolase YtcJ
VVLNGDPTKLPPEQIKDIKVEMTIIGGEVVREA